ncbi:MAG TPA: SGNH/GDSL hydrolase family protein [Spirochaetales bacterium]|nr:SGNH/GDSL hydrolase family protein [Spirochaetales bacterium]HRY54175.1 SGNH/GDSL hydrolase family protein [Spirochaetia bacterium]HRZ65669.1 SGNH/GDSL hydrolase family protein [Spirochaetia bacterium]
MRTALCFGDSNTWGYVPASGERYAPELRWTGVLAARLGPSWAVVAEGLNGRTTVLEDPLGEGLRGSAYLGPCLRSHKPIDLAILMLGSNDLKSRFSFGPFEIAEGVGRLVEIVRASGAGPGGQAPALLVACPAPLLEAAEGSGSFAGGREKSLGLRREFARLGAERGVPILYVEDCASSSPRDGLHLEAEAHAALGAALARAVLGLFPR